MKVRYKGDSQVLAFAKRELNKFNDSQLDNQEVNFEVNPDDPRLQYDGFIIEVEKSHVNIVGGHERSVLYGVYHFLEAFLGYDWFGFSAVKQPQDRLKEKIITRNPLFKRRGNVVETIKDTDFLVRLIDWGAKNYLNELFFTFFLWEDVRDVIYDELLKRGFFVTLGGHSLKFLLNRSGINPDQAVQLFDQEAEIQDIVINEIVDICKRDPIISRLSIWPEDIGVDQDKRDFLSTYIQFVERLKEKLKLNSLEVEVEHIAYNAGLSWNMLERREDTSLSKEVDTLYAFWGRDYSKPINDQKSEQQRGYQALTDWRNVTQKATRELTVFEYYSDHFMLTEIFPPLKNRIHLDIAMYQSLGVDGLLNLIVPRHYKQDVANPVEDYDWKWSQLINNYYFARSLWGMDSRLSEHVENILDQLEAIFSHHTGYNMPLFPKRVVDVEKLNLEEKDRLKSLFKSMKNELRQVNLASGDERSHKFHNFIENVTQIVQFYEKQLLEK